MHWLFRIGDGDHYESASKYKTWGVKSKDTNVKGFLNEVTEGDVLWFVKAKSSGKIYAVATYTGHGERTRTNEELGWVKTEGEWDTEVYYKEEYKALKYNILTELKGTTTVRKYTEKCHVNLEEEYKMILNYNRQEVEPSDYFEDENKQLPFRILYNSVYNYSENIKKNRESLNAAKAKGKGNRVSYEYLPENAYEEEFEVIRSHFKLEVIDGKVNRIGISI